MSKSEPTTIPAATADVGATSVSRPVTIKRHARELARRESDGIEVVLLWHPREDAVTLAVSDSRTGDQFELAVESSRALEAFYHPFAHAA